MTSRTPGPLGHDESFFSGFAWMASAGLLAKIATLGAHVVLGWLLTPGDFGLYALAAGLYVVLQGLQSGGVRIALVARGRQAAAGDLRNALIISLTAHLAIAASLWFGSPIAAILYSEPELVPLLKVMAAAIGLNSLWAVGGATLQNRRQFRRLAGVELTDGVTKAVLTIVLALAGFGAMSLVLPLPFISLFRSLVGVNAIRDEWQCGQRSIRESGRLVKDGAWILSATLAHALLTQGDYLGLGILFPTALLGIYYFAYQIPGQLGPLLASRLGDVLVPGLVARRSAGTMLSLVESVSTQFAAALTLGTCVLAASFPYIEEVIWQGRWSTAVAPAQVLSLMLALRLMHIIPKSLMQAQQRFPELFVWTILSGVGLVVLAGVIGGTTRSVTNVALGIGLYLAVVSMAFFAVALRIEGGSLGSLVVIRRVLACWSLGATITVGVAMLQRVAPSVSPWIAGPVSGLMTGLLIVAAWRLAYRPAYAATKTLAVRMMAPLKRRA